MSKKTEQRNKKHPFYDLLRNHILFLNNKKPVMRPKDEFFGDKNNTLEAKDFDKNQNKYIQKYITKQGKLSCSFVTVFYAKKLFKNYLKSKTYNRLCSKLNYFFDINKLKSKVIFNNNLEKQMSFICFDNYINPFEN